MFRYYFDTEIKEDTKLENEFSSYTGHKYVTAVNSCGSALFLSLKAIGLQHQEKVFTNAFTAVQSSIIHAGGIPIYVECNQQYLLDVDDFQRKIKGNPDVKYFIVSHMRGHISDMDTIKALCDENGIFLIKDCAHSLGAKWYEKQHKQYQHVGHHGQIACFSSQSSKLLNSGEGGFVACNH